MEDWTDIIGKRIKEERKTLPPGDWDNLEREYLARKRSRWIYTSIISLAAAAIAVLAVLLPYQSADINIINDTGIPDTVSELLAQYDSTETIIYPPRKRNFTIADQGTADQVAIAEKPESSTEGSINEEKMDEAQTARLLDNKEHPYYDNSTEEIYTRDRKKIVLSSRLGGLSSRASSGIRGINSSGMGIPYMLGANGGTTIHHSIPITFGLDIGFLIQERFVLTSGIEASVYKSEFSYSGDVGGARGIEQTAWFIGIPLKLEYTVWEADRFSSWIGAGGKVDRCIYARRNGMDIHDDTFNWSVLANAGIRYDLFDNIGIFLAPEVSWFFRSENTQLLTYRTENPLMFTVNAGVKFSF